MASLSEPVAATGVSGISKEALAALIAREGEGSIPAQARYAALARYDAAAPYEPVKPGRAWKHDLRKLDFSALLPFDGVAPARNGSAYAAPKGVTLEAFSRASELHPAAFQAAFGRALDPSDDKFALLALAFQNEGTFVDVAANTQPDDPIVISYAPRGAAACFPYTLVRVGSGARATVIERLHGGDQSSLFCGLTELVLEPGAELTYAVIQSAATEARTIFTRRARLERDSTLAFSVAELGAEHSVSRVRAAQVAPGGSAEVTAVFFSNAQQHVDLATEVVHASGHTRSHTQIRSAGTDDGQGRYFGNIKILESAHGADAALRDDALLLSPHSHIDSVPALEIAANDVKAFHGATVGAISEEQLFYAQSRGLPRAEAERMLALGFFEPAVARFPGKALREELRAALAGKLAGGDLT